MVPICQLPEETSPGNVFLKHEQVTTRTQTTVLQGLAINHCLKDMCISKLTQTRSDMDMLS